eukprot:5717293-Amphidinium_carterae.1
MGWERAQECLGHPGAPSQDEDCARGNCATSVGQQQPQCATETGTKVTRGTLGRFLRKLARDQ